MAMQPKESERQSLEGPALLDKWGLERFFVQGHSSTEEHVRSKTDYHSIFWLLAQNSLCNIIGEMGHQEVLWALLSEYPSGYANFLSAEDNLDVISPLVGGI